LRTIRMNLVWAFGYNMAALPLAAVGLLNPLISAAAMSLSSVFVVYNSLRLQNVRASDCDRPRTLPPGRRRRAAPRLVELTAAEWRWRHGAACARRAGGAGAGRAVGAVRSSQRWCDPGTAARPLSRL